MLLSIKDIKNKYHGDIISFAHTTMDIEDAVFLPDGSYQPIMRSRTIRPQTRELLIDFHDEKGMSDFMAAILEPFVLDLDDGYVYECYLKDKSESEEAYGAYTGSYTFSVLKKKVMRTVNEDSFFVQGNYSCNCRYEITSPRNMDTFMIDGYVIHNLQANRTFIIDGVKKLVYYVDTPDISAFDDIELLSFPKLAIGLHTIEKSDSDVQVRVVYEPLFM